MRRVNGEMRSANNAIETVNAAANAIATAETREPPPTSERRRCGGCWSIFQCFGSQKHSKRIGHAVAPDTNLSQTEIPPSRSLAQPPRVTVAFAAPPSSPASFLPSEPQSAVHSPAGSMSLTSIAANMYSPGGPRSIFAIGPYAHETQLVSPPLFSTYTTEPSTAPFTPPPESVHLTTPSSPEVPFAKLLDTSLRGGDVGQRFAPSQYEFQMYQYYPGSPLGQLVSPGSAFSGSGTSSPFLDHEYRARLLNLQSLPAREWGSCQGSGTLTPDASQPKSRDSFPLDRQNSAVSPLPCLPNEAVFDHRVSFELTAEDVVRCVEKKPKFIPKSLQALNPDEGSSSSSIGRVSGEDAPRKSLSPADGEEGQRCQRQRSASLGSIKEFNFDNADRGDAHKPCVGSDWWANEKVSGKEGEQQPGKNWSFFPMTQHGTS